MNDVPSDRLTAGRQCLCYPTILKNGLILIQTHFLVLIMIWSDQDQITINHDFKNFNPIHIAKKFHNKSKGRSSILLCGQFRKNINIFKPNNVFIKIKNLCFKVSSHCVSLLSLWIFKRYSLCLCLFLISLWIILEKNCLLEKQNF